MSSASYLARLGYLRTVRELRQALLDLRDPRTHVDYWDFMEWLGKSLNHIEEQAVPSVADMLFAESERWDEYDYAMRMKVAYLVVCGHFNIEPIKSRPS